VGDATLWDRLGDEPLLGALAVIIAGLVVVIGGILTWLVLRSLWDARLTRARDAFWRGLGRELVGAMGDAEREAAWLVRARVHSDDVLRHCIGEYMTRTSGAYREGLARLYRSLGLLDADLAELASRRWRVRMRALRRLAGVVTTDHRDRIATLAGEGGEIRLLVAQIVGRIGRAEDVITLLKGWKVTSRLTEYPVHVMVGALPIPELRRLVATWAEIDSADIQRIVLSEASQRVPSACWAMLPAAAAHPSKEVRIAACRAASHMTSEITLNLLLSLAEDDAWEVRAQAVKGLAPHKNSAADDVLVAALSDRNFWVRQNAAASLGRHGAVGVARLREVLDRSTDRYARDAAEHVLTDFSTAPTAAALAPAAGAEATVPVGVEAA